MKNMHLIEALRIYESPLFDSSQKAVIVTHENGSREVIGIHQACKMAADVIDQRDLEAEKFRVLVSQLKRYRFGDLYQRLMGEELPD